MAKYSHNSGAIERLRIYQAGRQLEDNVYELVKRLPRDQFYVLGNDLRRSSAAVAHYISEAHRRASLSLKLEAIHLVRVEADRLKNLLAKHSSQGYGNTDSLRVECDGITRQAWGLIRYYKNQQNARQKLAQISAADALVMARRS